MESTECPICNELLHINFLLTTRCCNQSLHKECFDKSLISTKGTCPFCRHIIIIVNQNPVYNNHINSNQINPNNSSTQIINSYNLCSKTANFLFCSCCILFFIFFIIFFNQIIMKNYHYPLYNSNVTSINMNSTKFNNT